MKRTAAFVFILFLFVSCDPKKEVIQPPKETKMLPPPAPETQPVPKKHLQTVTCEENTADMFNKSGMEVLPFVRLSFFDMDGKAVQEAKERVRSAIRNSYYKFPNRRITVNLAPADLKKEGPAYDLPIAIGIDEFGTPQRRHFSEYLSR